MLDSSCRETCFPFPQGYVFFAHVVLGIVSSFMGHLGCGCFARGVVILHVLLTLQLECGCFTCGILAVFVLQAVSWLCLFCSRRLVCVHFAHRSWLSVVA